MRQTCRPPSLTPAPVTALKALAETAGRTKMSAACSSERLLLNFFYFLESFNLFVHPRKYVAVIVSTLCLNMIKVHFLFMLLCSWCVFFYLQVFSILMVQLLVTFGVVALFTFW